MAAVRYNVIVFFHDSGNVCKYRNVVNVSKLLAWIELNLAGGRNWMYANIYDASTKQYLRRVYSDGYNGNYGNGFDIYR